MFQTGNSLAPVGATSGPRLRPIGGHLYHKKGVNLKKIAHFGGVLTMFCPSVASILTRSGLVACLASGV